MTSTDLLFQNTQSASQALIETPQNTIEDILNELAKRTSYEIPYLLEENKKDLDRLDPRDPKYDRLLLTEERLINITEDLRKVAKIPSPIGLDLEVIQRPNGLIIKKISVPFGVIGVIYEARPNVSFDVFALCLKSQNACILKGGSNAEYSNKAIVRLIHEVLDDAGLNPNICNLLDSERSSIDLLLKAKNYVDLIIPRGSQSLINYVRENALVPVIETGAGVCHTYFCESGNTHFGKEIIHNAKTRRVSVCNSLDCLIIHESRLSDLPIICEKIEKENVHIYADNLSFKSLQLRYPSQLLHKSTTADYGREFLDYKLAIKTVSHFSEAIEHIRKYGSKHSECIISEDSNLKRKFIQQVDAACVYMNSSTAFTDGGEFGFGAEIGISTQKMHARGPMGLRELCTHKWIIDGNGHTR